MNFKIALRMRTYRADIRCFGSYNDVSAVAALPDLDLALLEYRSCLDVGKKCSVSLFVMLLDSSDKSELGSKISKALSFRCLRKAFVHICPLIVLAVSCLTQIGLCVANSAELLEPHLGVLFLVVSGLEENSRDLLIAFLLGYRRKVCILVACL